MGIKLPSIKDLTEDVKDGAKSLGNTVVNQAEKAVNELSNIPGFDGDGDGKYDGKFVGAGTATWAAGTALSKMQGVAPSSGFPSGVKPRATIFVNGVATTLKEQREALQALADAAAREGDHYSVLGLHNATNGAINDLIQAATDKLSLDDNKAVTTLRDTVLTELRAGRSLHLVGHSQGGLIVSTALEEAKKQLIKSKMSSKQAEALMRKHVEVETYGSAAHSYTDGPKYVHYINDLDPVAQVFGVGKADPVFWRKNGGKDAKVHWIKGKNVTEARQNHDFKDMYLSHRKGFDEAYSDGKG